MLSGDVEKNPGPVAGLTLLHLNIRSLRNKLDVLETHSHDADIIAITESHLDNSITNEQIFLNGYGRTPFRKDKRIDSGGICIYFKETVYCERLVDFETDDIEILWIKIKTKNWWCVLGTVYRNPALLVEYWDRLNHNIADVVDEYGSNNVIIVGDLNEDLLNDRLRHLKNTISRFAFHQLIHEPTRITESTATLLDPFICGNDFFNKTTCEVLAPFCSDHCPILASIQTRIRVTKTKREVWLYKRANWDLFRAELIDQNLMTMFNDEHGVDKIVDKIENGIIQAARNAVPRKTVYLKSNDKSWVTPDLKYQMRERDKLFKKAKISKNVEDYELFKVQRNRVVNFIRAAKRSFQDAIVNKIDENNATDKEWWKLVGSVMSNGHSKIDHIPVIKGKNGELFFDDDKKAYTMNEFFASISSVNDNDMVLPDLPPLAPGDMIHSFEVDEDDVLRHLTQLDTKKAYGPDGISPMLLKNSANILAPVFTQLFKRCLRDGIYPRVWKRANVVPIFKKGDRQQVGNYRPVSLLCIGGKIFEKILYKHLFNHVAAKLSVHQSGFLPKHSTVTHLLELNHTVLRELDGGKEAICTFYDITKAFDKVSHKALLFKLRSFGISGEFIELLENYLTGRQQRVVLNGAKSTWEEVKAGVPQGSVLGPLLFLVFVNDIFEHITLFMRLFADDTTQLFSSINLINRYIEMQGNIDNLLSWCKQWCVSVNPTKTEYMLYSRRVVPSEFQLEFDGDILKIVRQHKHLGVIMDASGSWNAHIDHIISKSLGRVGILRSLKYKVNRKNLEIIYNSFIRPILEYADVVWDGIPDYLVCNLEKVQIEALRIITGLTVSCSTRTLYEESGYSPLKIRRKYHRLIMFYKLVHNEAPIYLTELLPPRVGEGNRYNLRNQNNFSLIPARTELFNKSFFPQTVRDWNELTDDIKLSPSLGIFKRTLKNILFLSAPQPWFYQENSRFSSIHHSRIRNKCSGLHSHLFLNHVRDNPWCPYCPNIIEDPFHYFFRCNQFVNQRTQMIEELEETFPTDTPNSLHDFLYGNGLMSTENNRTLFNIIQSFILRTKRFAN